MSKITLYLNKNIWLLAVLLIGYSVLFGQNQKPISSTSNVKNVQLAGVYTIDNQYPTGGTNYNSFDEAIDDLNNFGVSAPVVFNVTSDLVFPSFCFTAPNNYSYKITASGTATNTITFQKFGKGANPRLEISGNSDFDDMGILLYGADYITFDGIDIVDIGTTSDDYLDIGFYFSGPADNNSNHITIKNTTVDLNKANDFSVGIYLLANAPTSSENANSYNSFLNNTIQDANRGYYFNGSSVHFDTGNTIGTEDEGVSTMQNIGNNSSVTTYGMYFNYQKNLTVSNNIINNLNGGVSTYGIYSRHGSGTNYISNNTISNITCTGVGSPNYTYGIYCEPNAVAITHVNQNIVTSITGYWRVTGVRLTGGSSTICDRNKISGIGYVGELDGLANGLSVDGTSVVIKNNMIYDISAFQSTINDGQGGLLSAMGLNISGGTSVFVYYNTIYLNYISEKASNMSAALRVGGNPSTINMKNNIFVNRCDMTIGSRAVAFWKDDFGFANFSTENNNNVFSTLPVSDYKYYIYWEEFTVANGDLYFADFQTRVSPRESNSLNIMPPFVSSTYPFDVHINPDTPSGIESGGIEVQGVLNDFDGDLRFGSPGYAGNGTAPDIGADEIGNVLDLAAIELIAPGTSSCYSSNETVTVRIKNLGTETIDFSANMATISTEVTGSVYQALFATINSGTLASLATMDVDMSTALDMSTEGVYIINASSSIVADENHTNDAMPSTTRTVTSSLTLPQYIDFSGYNGTNLSSNFPAWREASGVGLPSGSTSTWTNNNFLGGTSARINLYSNNHNEWIVGPKITPQYGTHLKYKIAITDYNSADPPWFGMDLTDDQVIVKISTDCGQTFGNLFIHDASNIGGVSNSLVQQEISLSAYAGQEIILAFFATDNESDVPDYDFVIDDILIENSGNYWLGLVNSDWSLSDNWSNGVPNAADDVVITDSNHDPIISSTDTVNNITIHNGAVVTIAYNGKFSVNGILTNNNGTSGLVIKSTASGTGSLLHNTDNVEATIERYISGEQYHFVSVPLMQSSNPTASIFLNSYLMDWNPQIFPPNWTWYTGVDDPLSVNKGFMIWYTGSQVTYSMSGYLNNGSFNSFMPASDGSFNLVPNPFPSAIDWEAASGWTKTNVANAIYVYNNTQYASYVDGVGQNGGSNIIPVGQSFFVQSIGGPGILSLTNSTRLHHNQSFYKDQAASNAILRALVHANNKTDEMVIRIKNEAEESFDTQYDAQKMYGNMESPQFYSFSSDEQKLSINSLPFSTEGITIPLGFEQEADGEAIIDFTGIESFQAGSDIFFEDMKNNTLINLRKQAKYTFVHSEGNDAMRFRLHLKLATGTSDLSDSKAYSIWASDHKVFISIPELVGKSALIELFDMSGRKIYSCQEVIANPSMIHVKQISGIILVRISSENAIYKEKVYIQ